MKRLLLLGIMFVSLLGYGQTHEINHEKYWYYRYRMKNYFTNIGPDIYQSMVGARRNTEKTDKDIMFGDQTLDMGWYMGILAIEYHLLSYRNDPDELNETLTELYYLMQAFERLDKCEGKEPYARANASKSYFYLIL